MNLIERIKDAGYDRCGKCPAYWTSSTQEGFDCGCEMDKCVEDFCIFSIMPFFLVKAFTKYHHWREGVFWEKVYHDEIKREKDMFQMKRALEAALERNNMSIHMIWSGEKIDLNQFQYPFLYDLHEEFRKEQSDAAPSI